MIYTYALLDITNPIKIELKTINLCLLYKPYYIGKGTDDRIYRHRYIRNTKHRKDAKTSQLLKITDFVNIGIILKYYNTNEEAYNEEKLIIDEIGLDNLYNISPGGKGGFGNRKNKTYVEIYGDNAQLVKDKIAKSNTGKTQSIERRNKKSEEVKKYFENEDNKNKHIIALTGRKMPDSLKIATGKRFKGKQKSLEWKQKMKTIMTGKKHTKESIDNASYNRSKHKYIFNINNKKILVIRNIGMKIFEELGIRGKFYNIVKRKYIKINNIRIVIRKVERIRF